MPDLPRLIVVTGPPGAGKSTIAAALRDRLGLPLIAKDALKETLGDALDVRGGDREASRRLGVATFEVQFAVVRELSRAASRSSSRGTSPSSGRRGGSAASRPRGSRRSS